MCTYKVMYSSLALPVERLALALDGRRLGNEMKPKKLWRMIFCFPIVLIGTSAHTQGHLGHQVLRSFIKCIDRYVDIFSPNSIRGPMLSAKYTLKEKE